MYTAEIPSLLKCGRAGGHEQGRGVAQLVLQRWKSVIKVTAIVISSKNISKFKIKFVYLIVIFVQKVLEWKQWVIFRIR